MSFYNKTIESTFKELRSGKDGLNSEEAKSLLKIYGKNQLKEAGKLSIIKLLISQFKSFIIYVLLAATLISFLFKEYTDAIIIFMVVILNTLLGFYQEYKAEKSMTLLKKLSSPTSIVIRDNKQQLISSTDLVPGDIIIVEAGSIITADARIIESYDLKLNESTLTGESTPVEKSFLIINKEVQIADQKNMLFAGTIVVSGRAKAIVTVTAMSTELGKIASSLQQIEETQTPLQIKLRQFGFHITIVILAICLIIFVISSFKYPLYETLLISIALAVAVIPESLPAVITITLSLGTQRMLRKNSLIRKLTSVETLGSTTIICVDKTGTLTKNEMTVTDIYMNNQYLKLKNNSLYLNEEKLKLDYYQKLFEIASLCNDATENIYDPTEKALIKASKDLKLYYTNPRTNEIPFTPENKYMVTFNLVNNDEIAYMKGAPEIVLEKCYYIYKNGRILHLTTQEKNKILEMQKEMSSNALRVLAFAYSKDSRLDRMIFTGLIGMIDPPREEVKQSIEQCKEAGINVVMITGDHPLTAKAIASQIGIAGKTITGKELEKITVDKLSSIVENIAIYARVSPEHKLKIVNALQKKGYIVAMTGDGVNDTPALKQADIGIAIGSGTDIAKESSDLVLLDDNFSSIVSAVEEGRRTYSNIKKSIKYLFSGNLAEILVILISLILQLPLPLIAIQILWINLITDSFPALSLTTDPSNDHIMSKPPIKSKERLLLKGEILNLIFTGVIMTVGTLFLFNFYLDKYDLVYAQTIAFMTLATFQVINTLNYRTEEKTIFSMEFFKNKYILLALIVSFLLQFLVVYYLTDLFKITQLNLLDWLILIAVSSTVLVFQEIRKVFVKKTVY